MTIGKELATARRKKGIDIKNAEEATKIRVKFLEALENDDYENVPEPVYIKGFIRSYASFLGINSFDLVKKYDAILAREKKKQEAQLEGNKQKKPQNVRGCVVDPGIVESPAVYHMRKKFHLMIAAFVTLIAAVLILGVLGTIAPKSKISEKVNPLNKTVPGKKKESKKQKPKAVISGVLVRLVAKRGTWVRVKKDGLIYFVGVLKSNKEIKVHAKENVEVLTVDGSAFEVYRNNKYQGIMSKDKGPSRKSFIKNEQRSDNSKR